MSSRADMRRSGCVFRLSKCRRTSDEHPKPKTKFFDKLKGGFHSETASFATSKCPSLTESPAHQRQQRPAVLTRTFAV